ncbi:MerR family transcriptional regulator [Kordiimonas aestuarii]|uniref:MerR family transcriptional regulator n=1 Tax=Kordiimonas aestuarii TaxID=1005925 RepID=UPI0021CE6D95|nr:MerR family transcriptional regulator [Kordiimonas aestuarii]
MPADDGRDRPRGEKGREAFRTISEVADELDLPQHVLRFWESKFSQIKPLKRGGNRRYYRPDDVTLLRAIKALLHADGYTIKGVQKLFKAQGLRATVAQALGLEDDTVAPEADVAAAEETADSSAADEGTPTSMAALESLLRDLKAIRAKLD